MIVLGVLECIIGLGTLAIAFYFWYFRNEVETSVGKKFICLIVGLACIGVGIYCFVEGDEPSYSNDYSYSSFTNKYGTSTTECAHVGCSNYIASSGDTNCCITHSNRCYECNCYIDEDANWCME